MEGLSGFPWRDDPHRAAREVWEKLDKSSLGKMFKVTSLGGRDVFFIFKGLYRSYYIFQDFKNPRQFGHITRPPLGPLLESVFRSMRDTGCRGGAVE